MSTQQVMVARRLRARERVTHVDYLRAVRELRAQVTAGTVRQVDLARDLGMTQPAVSQALRAAASVALPREGFSGADPREICLRYAAGELDATRTVDELSRWDYAPILLPTDDVNDIAIIPDGSFDDVRQAVSEGLITWEMYEEIGRRSAERFPREPLARPTDSAEKAAQILREIAELD
jgi:DNA-binding transcriptional ArsR family regulator